MSCHYKSEILIKVYGFLSFSRKFGDKYGKTLLEKTGIDDAKTASKSVV